MNDIVISEKYQRGYAVIDLDAVRYNLGQIRKNISPDTKIIGVIKTDGYGHGAVPIGRVMERLDYVSGYAVATAEEAFILRRAGLQKPILVLGYTFPCSYQEMLEKDIRPTVFRYDTLEELAACAAKLGQKAKIHIKVDTGMSRIGVSADESGLAFVKKALSYPELEVEGIYTHFARADETEITPARKQFDQISQFWNQIESQTGYKIPVKHCSNSAGIIALKEANMDAVRAGIILYGLWPSDEVDKEKISLRPVLSFKSRLVYCKQIEAGTPVSYGGTYEAKKPMRIGTVPIGYGDGYPRGLSNKGYVLICGKRAPILGRICMDQFMVSLEGIPEAAPGMEVTLIGEDSGDSITMETLGELSGRFNYELACDLGWRIPRVYMENGKITDTKDYFSSCNQ